MDPEFDERERRKRAMMYVERLNYRDRVTTPTERVASLDDTADIPPAKILKHLKSPATREFGYKVLEKLLIQYSRTDLRTKILSAFARHPTTFPDDWNTLTVDTLTSLCKKPVSGCSASPELHEHLFLCLRYIGEHPSIFPSNSIFFLAVWSKMFSGGQQNYIHRWTCSSLCNPKRRPCDVYKHLGAAQPISDASSSIPPDKIIKLLTSAATRDFGYSALTKLLIQYCNTYNEIGILLAFARQPAVFPDGKTLTVIKLVISHLKSKKPFSGCLRCSNELREKLFSCLRYVGQNPRIFPSKEIFSLALRGKLFTKGQNAEICVWTSSSVCNLQLRPCEDISRTAQLQRSLETETDMKRSLSPAPTGYLELVTKRRILGWPHLFNSSIS